jgi:hypothetical protein
MALASSVRAPHSLLIAHSMILSASLWLHIHISKMRELRGQSEFAKNTSRCLLRSANLPRRFWPDALRHFCRRYAYWPDDNGLSAWEKLDHLQPNELRHNLVKDLHVFGSYVTGHLPRALLMSQIRPTMIVLKRVSFSEMTLLLLISGCIVFVLNR